MYQITDFSKITFTPNLINLRFTDKMFVFDKIKESQVVIYYQNSETKCRMSVWPLTTLNITEFCSRYHERLQCNLFPLMHVVPYVLLFFVSPEKFRFSTYNNLILQRRYIIYMIHIQVILKSLQYVLRRNRA